MNKEILEIKKELIKRRFGDIITPGSIVHLSLTGEIYWNIKEGKIVFEPDVPNHWPLEDFVGWYLHTSNLEIGPRLSPFSIYLRDGNRHTGLGYDFPWENINGYRIWNRHKPLFQEGDIIPG